MAQNSVKQRRKHKRSNEKQWIDAAAHIKKENPDLYDKSRDLLADRIIQKFGLDKKRKRSVYDSLKILYK